MYKKFFFKIISLLRAFLLFLKAFIKFLFTSISNKFYFIFSYLLHQSYNTGFIHMKF